MLPHTSTGPTQAGKGQPRRVTFDAAAPSALAPAAMDPVDDATPQALGRSGGGRLQGNTPPALTEGRGNMANWAGHHGGRLPARQCAWWHGMTGCNLNFSLESAPRLSCVALLRLFTANVAQGTSLSTTTHSNANLPPAPLAAPSCHLPPAAPARPCLCDTQCSCWCQRPGAGG